MSEAFFQLTLADSLMASIGESWTFLEAGMAATPIMKTAVATSGIFLESGVTVTVASFPPRR